MSKNIKQAEMARLLKGEPKRATRGPISRIVSLAESVQKDGIAYFPYYTKNAPEHEAYRGADTRRLLEREMGPFFYTTGNWDHLYDGADVMAVWVDEKINDALTEAGFRVREQNTAKRNLADEADEANADDKGEGAE
jgi:hypothetical protein